MKSVIAAILIAASFHAIAKENVTHIPALSGIPLVIVERDIISKASVKALEGEPQKPLTGFSALDSRVTKQLEDRGCTLEFSLIFARKANRYFPSDRSARLSCMGENGDMDSIMLSGYWVDDSGKTGMSSKEIGSVGYFVLDAAGEL